MKQIIVAPSLEIPKNPTVFLGGGITGCDDWQPHSRLTGSFPSLKRAIFSPCTFATATPFNLFACMSWAEMSYACKIGFRLLGNAESSLT